MSNPDLIPQTSDETGQWAALKSFATRLLAQARSMSRKGKRGFSKNIEILESWVRSALAQLADTIELPSVRRKPYKRPSLEELLAPAKKRDKRQSLSERRRGFRAIEPDEIERARLAQTRKRPAFDITSYTGPRNAGTPDRRKRYLRRLEAIMAVLSKPEMYARRVKRVVDARRKRGPIRTVTLQHRAALPELLRLPRNSDLARTLWYFDSS